MDTLAEIRKVLADTDMRRTRARREALAKIVALVGAAPLTEPAAERPVGSVEEAPKPRPRARKPEAD